MSQPLPPAPPPSSTPPPRAAYWTRTALVLAAVLLVAGGWVLLSALGVRLPPLSRHWPLFLIVGGIASIADWALVSKRAGALGRGVFAIALGVDLYLVTLRRIPWRHVRGWGPGIYLAVGLACLAAYAVDAKRSPRLLVFGVLGVGLAITFWGWGQVPLGIFWGGLLLLLGGALVAAVVRRGRGA
ncbi:MAG TPA: hypothetical protein VGS57_07510 [Thermoanaerobaculia bacterium]|jgi:hypothetical protein|nr:hypothetical protein [Thermoanaerobaculia bacterium]